MSGSLTWSVDDTTTTRVVALTGRIDEDSDFESLGEVLKGATKLDLELSGIRSINSCGVREWIHFVRNLPDFEEVRYLRCSPFVVLQLNMKIGRAHV